MEELEIELGDRTLTIPAERLCRAQAAWRGALVRRHLTSLRATYEQVVRETELPGFSLHLTWPADPAAAPRFSRSDRQGLTITERPVPPKHEPPKTSLSVTQHQVESRPPTETHNSTGIQCEKEIPVPIEHEVVGQGSDKGDNLEAGSTSSEGQRTGGGGLVTGEGTERLSGQEVEDGRQSNNQGFTSTQHTTGVWDSVDVSRFPGSTPQQPEQLDRESLLNESNTIAMELMWIQQAIDSRKQYLRLRDEMSGSAT